MAPDARTMSVAELQQLLREKRAQEKKEKAAGVAGYERDRDRYIDKVFGRMEELSAVLRTFKEESVRAGLDLHARMYTAHGRTKRREPDTYSLVSADGTRRITIERHHCCAYDETSTVAIETIREVLRSKFEGRNKGMYGIIDGILMKNRKGDYDERLVAKLRKHETAIGDPAFSEALDLLARAYRPTSSRIYIRAYRKNAPGGRWVDMPMNWSSM